MKVATMAGQVRYQSDFTLNESINRKPQWSLYIVQILCIVLFINLCHLGFGTIGLFENILNLFNLKLIFYFACRACGCVENQSLTLKFCPRADQKVKSIDHCPVSEILYEHTRIDSFTIPLF